MFCRRVLRLWLDRKLELTHRTENHWDVNAVLPRR
jgi:hypothetical protein